MGSFFIWIYTSSCTLYIYQGHERFSVLACCHWTAENVDHILEFGDKMNLDSLQEGLILDTETLSISNLPFAVHWIAESSKAVDLP